MIQVENLTKSFNNQMVLNQIYLTIPDEQLVVILGESGSGKSVFLQHLIGILKPDQGSIRIGETDITRLSEARLLKIRRNIGYLFQEGALYDFMTVFENVAFPLREHARMKKKEITAKVMENLERLGLAAAKNKMPSELSGGMKKRCALARSIIFDSKILLCDEPTSGLDPIRSRDISDRIREVTRQMRCTTVVTSHDIPNTLRIADQVVLIHEGEIRARGTPKQIAQSTDNYIRKFIQSAQTSEGDWEMTGDS